MFDPNANNVVGNFEWTIKVKHGEHELTFHSIAAFANFLLFPYFAHTKKRRVEQGDHHYIADAAFTLMRALRAHTGLGLKDLRDFIMGEKRFPES